MTDTELKTWERDLRELTTEELRLLAKLLELKQQQNKKTCHQSGN